MNFTNAAEELNISQSAVSQQMRSLTRRLQFPLFRKQSNKLYLTHEGDALAKIVGKALSEIEQEITRLSAYESIGDLRIGVDQSFAIGWLLPKLDRFEARLMDSRVSIKDNQHRLRLCVEEDDDGVDISIQILDSMPDIVSSIAVPVDSYVAICSPESLCVGSTKMTEEEFKRETLLALSPAGRNDGYTMDIHEWSEQSGFATIPSNGKELYSTTEMLMQAVIHCRGVAIIRASLADDHLRAKRVVKAVSNEIPCRSQFCVSWLENSNNIINIREFVEWFKDEFSPSDSNSS